MQPVKKVCEILVASIVVSVGVFVLPAYGQAKVVEKTAGPFEGTVVDAAGKPVVGATVWLIGGERDDPQIIAETTSKEKGRFQIAKQPWKMSELSERSIPTMLAARDSTGRIGGSVYSSRPQLSNDVSPKEFQIKLQNAKDFQSRLVDLSGQPIAGAKIRPATWATDWSREEQVQHLIFLPSRLMKEMTTETGADGRFTLRNLPTVGHISVKIAAEGFGEPMASWRLEKPTDLRLGRVGSIRGSLACRQDPKAAAEIKLRLATDSPPRRSMADVNLYYFAEGTTEKDGSFQFGNVPPGRYAVRPQLSDTSPYYSESGGPIKVASGKTASASVTLQRAVKLQGKVVDQQTGEGVPGIRVMLYFNDASGRGRDMKPATTDAKGAFTLYTRPGKASVQLWPIPDQYINPASSRQQQPIEVKDDATLEPFRLERAKVLEGIVVDKAGKPVADAEIRYTDTDYSGSLQDIFRSDAAGKFTLKKISPQKTLIIRARTKTAVAEPVNVVPAKLKEPLRLVVDEKTAFSLRGTVLNEAGKPIPQANVGLTSHWMWGSGGVSFQSHTCKTDDAGRFEFGGLWPGDRYQISVSVKDCERYGSPTVEAKPGGQHDFGKITILAANGTVEGVAVDSEGKRLANIRVFNSGDGLKLIDTVTDEAGEFRLQGFRSGPVFVFAEKPGFRFAGVRTNSGDTNAVLTMYRTEEPVPRRSAPSAASRNEAEKKAARKALAILLAAGDDGQKQWARARIARMDSEQNQKNVANPAPPSRSNEPPIHKTAEEDLDEALSLAPKPDDQACNFLVDLAKHFASKDPEKSLRCAAEAVVRARNLDQPQRTVRLAEMGALVTRLGNKEAGRKLALEAAETAAKWQVTDHNRWTLNSIAKAVAVCDVDRGAALLEKFSKTNERDRFVAELAASLDDVEKAESLLKGVQAWYAQDAHIRLAYRIAAKRPAEAVRILENIDSRSAGSGDESKAAAFGWVATAIAPHDKALAHRLIDRGLEILLAPSEHGMNSYGGRPARAAILALEAQEIGYPDVESVVYRVLAARATAGVNDFSSPVVVQECNMMMALYLALIDPVSAKQVLQAVEPHSDCIGSGYSGIRHADWFKAWALADPPHTIDLAERELASAKDSKAKQEVRSGLMEAVELWLTAPGERLNIVSRNYRHMFPPVEEN